MRELNVRTTLTFVLFIAMFMVMKVEASSGYKLFVSATNLETGQKYNSADYEQFNFVYDTELYCKLVLARTLAYLNSREDVVAMYGEVSGECIIDGISI